MWTSFQDHYCRTVSNCRSKPKTPATVGALPTSDNAEMGGGDMDGDGGDDTPECTITPILQDDGQPVRELVNTAKPKKKCTKCACERDDMAAKVLTMLEMDDNEDEVSLALASTGKHIKKSLNDAQVDAVLDELNEVVGCHVRTARGGGIMGYQRQPSVLLAPQTQVPPQQQQTSNYHPMPPPPLQRLDIAYDPMTNNSYQNL